VLGALNFLANWTRPDISCAVSMLAGYNLKHNKVHWEAVKRVVRYVFQTKDMKLVLGGTLSEKDAIPIQGYSDASFNSSGRSRSGYALTYLGHVFAWRSRNQKQIADSSAVAEIHAAVKCQKHLRAMGDVLDFLGLRARGPLLMYVDNKAALNTMKNASSMDEVLYIGGKTQHLREAYRHKIMDYQYCPTTEMAADVMTKALGPHKHELCLNLLGIEMPQRLRSAQTGGVSHEVVQS
jgi:hypothetical protein